jgi:hypothetical protein
MAEVRGRSGFAAADDGSKLSRRRRAALELLATITLAVSIIVAASAVSMANKSANRVSHAFARLSYSVFH